MKKDRRWVLIVLGLLAAFLIVYFGFKWWNKDVVTIKTIAVSRGTIEAIVSVSGFVDAPVYDLSPKMGGKIINIFVKEGARVQAAQTLAEFDDLTRLIAPAGGIVAKINYDKGETVPMGMPAIVVVNFNRSWVEAQIDEIDIETVRVGDKVRITSDVYPDKVFMGEIYWIAPLAELRKVGGRVKMDEESYVFPCKIRFVGGHEGLKVNMSVNVDILTKVNDQALILPREAVIAKDDSSYVYKVNRGRVAETKVEVGIRSYSSLEAVSGVKVGDIVAVSNVAKLKNKGRIKIER
ncbi:MAG: efflux RND transporter periplasmic adaptor subunit [bacterium]